MSKSTRVEREIERQVDRAFQKHSSGRQIRILDLPKIHKLGMEAGHRGEDIYAAVEAAISLHEFKLEDARA